MPAMNASCGVLRGPRSQAVTRPIVSSYAALMSISAVKLTPMVWIMLRVSQSAPPCSPATRVRAHVELQKLEMLSM